MQIIDATPTHVTIQYRTHDWKYLEDEFRRSFKTTKVEVNGTKVRIKLTMAAFEKWSERIMWAQRLSGRGKLEPLAILTRRGTKALDALIADSGDDLLHASE